MRRITASAITCVIVRVGLCASAARATTCTDMLGNNAYDCTIVSEANPTPVQSCFEFSTPGSLCGKFDLHAEGATLGCTCRPGGNAKKPKFNTSKPFDCVGTDGALTVHIAGKAGKYKISKGHREDSSGAGTVSTCNLSAASYFECPGGETDCSGLCVDLATDPQNCGSCDNECVVANATAGCSGSTCSIAFCNSACNSGFANCNNLTADGCEINTTSNVNDCSGCGQMYGQSQPCINSICV